VRASTPLPGEVAEIATDTALGGRGFRKMPMVGVRPRISALSGRSSLL